MQSRTTGGLARPQSAPTVGSQGATGVVKSVATGIGAVAMKTAAATAATGAVAYVLVSAEAQVRSRGARDESGGEGEG